MRGFRNLKPKRFIQNRRATKRDTRSGEVYKSLLSEKAVVLQTDTTQNSANQSIVGDFVWTDIIGLSFNFNFKRSTPMLVFGVIGFILGGSDARAEFRVKWGTNVFPDLIAGGWTAGIPSSDITWENSFSFTHFINMPSGHITLVVQAARSTPDETFTIVGTNDNSTFGYVILQN